MSKSGQALAAVLKQAEKDKKKQASAKALLKKRDDEQKLKIASEQRRLRAEFYARRES